MADTSVLNLRIDSKQALAALKTFNSKLNGLGKTVSLKVSAPLAALEGVAIKTFSEMEKGLTDITNLLDKGEGFAAYEENLEGVQEMAIEMGFAIDDVNKSLFDNVSALGQGDVALEAYAEAQKLAIGGNAQLSETVDGLTSVINAYGRETTDAKDVANAFFSAQQKGKTTVSELASNIGKVAPIAKSAGIGFKELLATMSTLTLGGLSTDEATTALRATISALVKPTKEAEEVLRSLGVPIGALELQEKGLGFALAQLSKAQEDNADQLAKAIPNIRALTGVTSFSADKLDILRETQEKMNDDIKNGTGLNEAYADSLDDFTIISKQAFGAIKTLTGAIGELLIDGLDLKTLFADMAEGAKDLKEYIQDMSPEMKKTAVVLAGIATIAPPAVVGITGMASAFGILASGLSTALPILTAAAIPIAAIAAVAAGGIAIGSIAYDAVHGEEIAEREAQETKRLEYLKKTAEWQKKINDLEKESLRMDKEIQGIEDKREADSIEELMRLDEERFNKQIELDEKRAAKLEGTLGADIFERINKEMEEEKQGYGSELGLIGLESPEETIKALKTFELGISGLDLKGDELKEDQALDEQQKINQQALAQKVVEGAFLKNSLQAQKLEKTQFGGKIQNKQLKEAEKANRYLNTIASNQTSNDIADF